MGRAERGRPRAGDSWDPRGVTRGHREGNRRRRQPRPTRTSGGVSAAACGASLNRFGRGSHGGGAAEHLRRRPAADWCALSAVEAECPLAAAALVTARVSVPGVRRQRRQAATSAIETFRSG